MPTLQTGNVLSNWNEKHRWVGIANKRKPFRFDKVILQKSIIAVFENTHRIFPTLKKSYNLYKNDFY